MHKISIIPRGVGALGYTIQRPTEDRFLMTREELENKMAVLLGGRAAEHVVFGAPLDRRRRRPRQGHRHRAQHGDALRHGCGPGQRRVRVTALFVPGGPGGAVQERRYSEATAREIDVAVRKVVDDAFHRTVALLEQKRSLLEEGARALLEKETLNEDELAALVSASSRHGTPQPVL